MPQGESTRPFATGGSVCFAASMLSKKKARRIVVDDQEYFWVATGQNGYIDLFVERNVPSSPKLTCVFDYGDGARQVAVTPSVARRAIVRARELGWNPDAPGKDLRLQPDEHKIEIQLDRIRHFYKIYETLKPALHPNYEHLLGEPYLDIDTITDNLWNLDPGDEFWRAAIDVLGLHFGQDTKRFESRLATAHTVEVDHGYVGAYMTQDGQLVAWAHGHSARAAVQLGGDEARAFSRGLRKLASLREQSGKPVEPANEWRPARGDVYLTLPFLDGLQPLSPDDARKLAQRLVELSHDIAAESPTPP